MLDSPFGLSGSFERPYIQSDDLDPEKILILFRNVKNPYRRSRELGVQWVRPGSDIYWGSVQPTPGHRLSGENDWRLTDIFYGCVPAGIRALGTIDPLVWGKNTDPAFLPGTWQFRSPEDESAYVRFVKAAVDRYDGDGTNDMPGLANPVRYWQIGNEPAARPLLGIRDLDRPMDWNGFAHLARITIAAIRASDPDARIVLAGLAAGYPNPDDHIARRELFEFFGPLIGALRGQPIDAFDIHSYGNAREGSSGWGCSETRTTVEWMRHQLDRHGFRESEIWMTETAVPSRPYGEEFQAVSLVKRYACLLSSGVSKIFWWNMIEGEPPLSDQSQPSRHFGLVYDGFGTNDPGYGVEKQAYATYRKMTELLGGLDWFGATHVVDEGNISCIRFDGKSGRVWIAWTTDGSGGKITINDIRTPEIRTVLSVPVPRSSGRRRGNSVFFTEKRFAVSDGSVSVEAGDIPVYILESEQ